MEIKVNLIGNSTITVVIDDVVKFGMDPALDVKGSSLGFGIYRKKNPVYNADTFRNVDFWLLTHAHLDHIDIPGVAVVQQNIPIIAAPSCGKTLKKLKVQNKVEYIDWNEEASFEKDGYYFTIRAIPAYHGYGKLVVKLMTRVNGYLITIQKGRDKKTIYVTSDTIYNRKVESALSGVKADILIANLGEAKAPLPVTRKPITMDVHSLQRFEQLVKARYVVPLHIDDYSHFKTKQADVQKHYELLEEGTEKVFTV